MRMLVWQWISYLGLQLMEEAVAVTAQRSFQYTKKSVVYQYLAKYLINRDVELGSLQICESRLNRNSQLAKLSNRFSPPDASGVD